MLRMQYLLQQLRHHDQLLQYLRHHDQLQQWLWFQLWLQLWFQLWLVLRDVLQAQLDGTSQSSYAQELLLRFVLRQRLQRLRFEWWLRHDYGRSRYYAGCRADPVAQGRQSGPEAARRQETGQRPIRQPVPDADQLLGRLEKPLLS